jgi:beta-phosphoglucomutase-like phosphatase (HAD superfamily)
MKTELVIFDMDGLTFNTEELSFKCWSKALTELGLEPDIEVFSRSLGGHEPGLDEIYKERYPGYSKDDIFVMSRKYKWDIVNSMGIQIKNGFLELIRYLKENGIKTAIGSSSPKEAVLNYFVITGLNVSEIFDYIACGDMVEKVKPNPDIFLLASRLANVPPERCLVLEDSKNGCYAAKAAGIPCIIIPDLSQPKDDVREIAAAVLPSLKDVIGYLEKQ